MLSRVDEYKDPFWICSQSQLSIIPSSSFLSSEDGAGIPREHDGSTASNEITIENVRSKSKNLFIAYSFLFQFVRAVVKTASIKQYSIVKPLCQVYYFNFTVFQMDSSLETADLTLHLSSGVKAAILASSSTR